MPRGHRTFALQQLALDEGLEGERLARCVAVLGGASGDLDEVSTPR
jgi:hypothetical protein